MNKEQEIIDSLKRQREQIVNTPRLSNLVKLYDETINIHERRWANMNGCIMKSEPVDLKPILDAVGEENKKNEEDLKLLNKSKCKNCSPDDTEEETTNMVRNRLGMLVKET